MANYVDLDIINDLPWLVLQEESPGAHSCLAAFSSKDDAAAFCQAAKERARKSCKVVRAVPEDYQEK